MWRRFPLIAAAVLLTAGGAVIAGDRIVLAEAAGDLDSEVLIGLPGDEPVDASSALLIRPSRCRRRSILRSMRSSGRRGSFIVTGQIRKVKTVKGR